MVFLIFGIGNAEECVNFSIILESSGVRIKFWSYANWLLTIPLIPPWIFIDLFACSRAWSAPSSVYGMLNILAKKLPSFQGSSSFYICAK